MGYPRQPDDPAPDTAGNLGTSPPWSVNTAADWNTEIFRGNFLICEVIGGQRHIVGQERSFVLDEANAALIVKAVNAHDNLVSALKAAKDFIGNGYQPPELVEQMQKALSLASGRQDNG